MDRNKKLIENMFILLRSELCGVAQADTESLSAENLVDLYKLAKAHDLAHLVASALSKRGLLGEDEVSRKLQKQMMLAVHRYSGINYDLGKAADALEKAEIPFLPLKGSVIRAYYPEPWMRTSCDIDILIHKEDTDRAVEALTAIGFEKQPDTTMHDHQLISRGGVHLELHYSLRQETSMRQADSVLDDVWQSCSVEESWRYRYKMTSEMFLFYHIVHMANHFVYGGCGVRPFLDLWLLEEKMELDREEFGRLLKQTGLESFYESARALSSVWMDNSPHSDITAQMEQFILTGGVYGTVSNSAAVKSAKGQSKLRSFMKLVFLSRKNLEITYPNLKKHPILLPFYQVKRWFKVLDPKKRKRVADVTAARNSVSKEQSDSVKALLDDLNLL